MLILLLGGCARNDAAVYEAPVELCYYNSNADMAAALEAGKVEAYCADNVTCENQSKLYEGHRMISIPISTNGVAFFFPKDDPERAEICEQLNDFLDKMRADGTPEQIFMHPQKERTRRFILGTRLLELDFRIGEYDYPETLAKVEAFCLCHCLHDKQARVMVSVFEELCQQILGSALAGGTAVHFSAEYRQPEERMYVGVRYGGESFDPRQSGNALALSILTSNIEQTEYSRDPSDAEMGNLFRFECIGFGTE